MTPHKPSLQKCKKTPKFGHPKFKRLKKRLQYRTVVEDARNIEDEDEEILEEQLPAASSKKQRKKQNFFNRASPMKVVTLYKHQNDSHKHIISNNGFDSFLKIKCSKLHPSLCHFLMESFNVETCELEFPSRGSIPITDKLVQKVLGLPMGQYHVVHQTDEEAISFVMLTLGFRNGKQPELSEVKVMLKSMELGDPVYFMMWVLYVVCSMLAPTTGVYISPKCYPTIMDPTKIRLLNWCRFVIAILIEAAKEKSRKNPFKACMAFLMIAYIDALETTDLIVDKHGTRICCWDNKSVASAILQDTKPDGSFGLLPEMEKYRIATRQMYGEIDDAISKFLKNVGTNTESTVPVTEGTSLDEESFDCIPSEDDDFMSASNKFEECRPIRQSRWCRQPTVAAVKSTVNDRRNYRRKEHHQGVKINTEAKPIQIREPIKSCLQKPHSFPQHEGGGHKNETKRKLQSTVLKAKQPICAPHPCAPARKKARTVQDDHENQGNNQYEDVHVSPSQLATIGNEGSKDEGQQAESNVSVQLNDELEGSKDEGQQAESKVSVQLNDELDPLDQIKMCASDSQSSIDETKEAKPYEPIVTSATTIVPGVLKGCLKHTDGATTQNINIGNSIGCPDGTPTCAPVWDATPKQSDSGSLPRYAPIWDGTPGGSNTHPIAWSSVTKKSVTWADHTSRNEENAHHNSESVLPQDHVLQDVASMPTIHTEHVLQDVVASSPVEVSIEQSENNSPRSISRSRTITRSMSPLKPVLPTKQATSPLTRSITSANPELLLMQGISDNKKQSTSAASSSKQITPSTTSLARRSRLGKNEVTPSPKGKKNINLVQDSMSRKLLFGSREWVPGEAPSFDLGFDDPKEAEQPTFKVDPTTGFPVITSSNEEEFYGPAEDYEILAAQAGEKYFPSAIVSETCSSGTSVNALPPHSSVDEDHVAAVQSSTMPLSKVKNNEGTGLPDAHVSDSKTPVPQAHQKRILKPVITQRSPFVTDAKSTAPNIPKDTIVGLDELGPV
ncbi:hypothetical protein ACQ4PT_039271 [Festuca glaucescens]